MAGVRKDIAFCLFCGNKRLRITHENDRDGYCTFIHCGQCGSRGPYFPKRMPVGPILSDEKREAGAIKLWDAWVDRWLK